MLYSYLVGGTVPYVKIVQGVPEPSGIRHIGSVGGDSYVFKNRRSGYYPGVGGHGNARQALVGSGIGHPAAQIVVQGVVPGYVLRAHLDGKLFFKIIAFRIKLAIDIDVCPPAYVP